MRLGHRLSREGHHGGSGQSKGVIPEVTGPTNERAPMTPPPGATLNALPFADFAVAARTLLPLLQDRLGFGLWAVTAMEGSHQRLVVAVDRRYGVREGQWYPWLDGYCARMLHGIGPRVAWDVRRAPAYAYLPTTRRAPILAFVGVPLCRADGTVTGALCAVDPLPQPPDLVGELALIEVLARLLSTLQERSDR